MTRAEACDAYKRALDALPNKGDVDAASKVMTLLLARDELNVALIENSGQDHLTALSISDLDERLKEQTAAIDAAVGRPMLAAWRQSIHPLSSPWWWRLDERAAASEPGQNPLWSIPAAVLFVLSLSVIADTITTLKNGGLNRLSVFGTLMQTVLALVAGSTFLTSGREWLEQFFATFNINRKFQGLSRVIVAAVIFGLTLGISLLLPYLVARYRSQEGDRFFMAKQYASAAENYQQAVALQPSLRETHFDLALSYDKARDYQNAIREYELSLQLNPKDYRAANNLARLNILQGNANGALRLLKPLIENLEETPTSIHYHLFKNRGWAYLELNNLEQAKDDLTWALSKEDGATAHYLLGRVYDEQKQSKDAKAQWNAFIPLSTKTQPVLVGKEELNDELEPNWVAHAYEQLLKGDAK